MGISSVNDQQRATKKKSVWTEVNGRTASTLLHLPVGVHPHPHLWSQVLGNPPQKKIVDTNSSNEFSPEGGWVQPW